MRWFLLFALVLGAPQIAQARSYFCAHYSNGYKRSEIYYYRIDDITPAGKNRLQDYLKYCMYSHIIIRTHTNDTDDDKANQKLSQKRAEFMLKKMTEYGYDPKRIEIHAYGNERPFITKSPRKKEPLNRRIDIEIIW